MRKLSLPQMLVYGRGLIVSLENGDSVNLYDCVRDSSLTTFALAVKCGTVRIIPHLRSMAQIHDTLIIEGYNGSKPFIPSEVIEEMIGLDFIGQDCIQFLGDLGWENLGEVIDFLNLCHFNYHGDIEYIEILKP